VTLPAAGFLHAWREGGDPAEALAQGVRLGALAVAVVGGRPAAGQSGPTSRS
jgi:sugar/nucleoside kinase (ribokinase family)